MDFTLREWTIDDADALAKYANNPKIANNLTDNFPHPYTKKNAIFFISNITTMDTNLIYAIDHQGEAVGGIGLHMQDDVYRKNAELGYWLAEAYWGKGIMTRLIPKAIESGFDKLDIHRIYARPYGRNIASQRVLEKCGLKLEARLKEAFYKNNQYEDELIYTIFRSGT